MNTPIKWIIPGCLLISAFRVASQPLLSGGAVLASARQDPVVVSQEGQLKFNQLADLRLPFVEQIGLRTETDRFELRREEYLTRVSVNGIREIQAQRQVQRSDQELAHSKLRILLHEVLLDRYRTLVDYRFEQRKLDLQRQLLLVYRDQTAVLQKLAAQQADVDLEAILKTEYDRDDLALRLAAAEGNLNRLHATIGQWVPETPAGWQLDTAGNIPASRLAEVLAHLPQTEGQGPALARQQARLQSIDAAYRLEKAKAGQILDFFQLRYNNRPDEPLRRDLSVGIGVNLPYKGSARLKMNALKIEQQETELEWQLEEADRARAIAGAREQLNQLEQQYRLAQQLWLDSQARFTLEQSALAEASGPLPLLKARELQLKRQLTLLDLENEMFSQYLKVLDWTGALSDAPAVNYLSASLSGY